MNGKHTAFFKSLRSHSNRARSHKVYAYEPAITFRLLLFLLVLFCAGCTSSTDVSEREPYRAYVGHTVALRRPMLLIKHSGYFFGGSNDVMSARHVNYGLTEPGIYKAPRVFAELPPGHRLTIDTVQDEVCIDSYLTAVYGRTTFPLTGKEISFAYTRAPMPYSASQPFPWETR